MTKRSQWNNVNEDWNEVKKSKLGKWRSHKR